MIALTKEKREELNTFINASIEQRCTVYTLKKQRELEELRDQIALGVLTAEPVAEIKCLEDLSLEVVNVSDGFNLGRHAVFTAPPVPEINLPHELMDLVKAVEFYHSVKAENPDTETGMWRDAYDWIKKAAVEAAPVIKRLNGLGE